MPKTVMIVDDAVSIRGLASMTLENSGYQVIEAYDGKDALEKISGQKVNMVITDLNMPNMGGLEFIKAMKADSRYRFIPIVILTKENEPDLKHQGRQAGAKAWITKPFKPKTILGVVQKVIG
ncbi:response regulator [Desulfonema magnum]|uniref:Two component system response regulator n=1 Tax=Desulfonema magnum TaxID=45655 RepID=A0A975GNR7_9BACT|nr:response regulator [Desulfonema magnum]QTA88065.1 Two component system response regulator [Desulfonema magnum]